MPKTLKEPTITLLLKDLRSKNYSTRWFAAEVIGTKRNLSPKKIEHLILIMQKSDVGEVLCWGLGQMKASGAISAIAKMLEHPDSYFRWRAAEALRDMDNDDARCALEQTLRNSPIPDTRWKCAWALGEIGNINSFDTLWISCQDPDRYVRWKSIWAISILRGNVENLIRNKIITEDLPEYMVWRSLWLLGRIGNLNTLTWMKKSQELKRFIYRSQYLNWQLQNSMEKIKERVIK